MNMPNSFCWTSGCVVSRFLPCHFCSMIHVSSHKNHCTSRKGMETNALLALCQDIIISFVARIEWSHWILTGRSTKKRNEGNLGSFVGAEYWRAGVLVTFIFSDINGLQLTQHHKIRTHNHDATFTTCAPIPSPNGRRLPWSYIQQW